MKNQSVERIKTDGIIFDIDGTLWDSREVVAEAWNEVIRKYYPERGELSPEFLTGLFGKPMDEIAKALFPELAGEKLERMADLCFSYENEVLYDRPGTVYPKVKETLEALSRKVPLFIVSNCQDGYIQTFLEFSGLGELFDDFESAGATGLSKGENNKLVIERNGIDRAIYIGDTQGDLNSADFAGIPFVHAAYGFGKTDRQTPSANSFDEIPEIVKEMFGE